MIDFDDYDWEFANHTPHPAATRLIKLREIYEHESLRGRMLIVMGFVEDILARSISSYLINDDEPLLKRFGSRALGNLNAKASLAYLLGLIDRTEFEIIEKMAKIRNTYAHEPFASKDDPTLKNHIRDLAALQGFGAYKESETEDYFGTTWDLTIWTLLTGLTNRPERAAERRLRFESWPYGAP